MTKDSELNKVSMDLQAAEPKLKREQQRASKSTEKKLVAAPKKQSRKPTPNDFASVAKRLACDEDKEAFERKLGKIAKAKPGHLSKRGGRRG